MYWWGLLANFDASGPAVFARAMGTNFKTGETSQGVWWVRFLPPPPGRATRRTDVKSGGGQLPVRSAVRPAPASATPNSERDVMPSLGKIR